MFILLSCKSYIILIRHRGQRPRQRGQLICYPWPAGLRRKDCWSQIPKATSNRLQSRNGNNSGPYENARCQGPGGNGIVLRSGRGPPRGAPKMGLGSRKPPSFLPQRVHVGIWYILRAQRGSHIPTLRPKYIPYTYMDPLGSTFTPNPARNLDNGAFVEVLYCDNPLAGSMPLRQHLPSRFGWPLTIARNPKFSNPKSFKPKPQLCLKPRYLNSTPKPCKAQAQPFVILKRSSTQKRKGRT